jgi:hypothetical protein
LIEGSKLDTESNVKNAKKNKKTVPAGGMLVMLIAAVVAIIVALPGCEKAGASKNDPVSSERVAAAIPEAMAFIVRDTGGESRVYVLRPQGLQLCIWTRLEDGKFVPDFHQFSLVGYDMAGQKVAVDERGDYCLMTLKGEAVSANSPEFKEACVAAYKAAMPAPTAAPVIQIPVPIQAPVAPAAAPAPAPVQPAGPPTPPAATPPAATPPTAAAPAPATQSQLAAYWAALATGRK